MSDKSKSPPKATQKPCSAFQLTRAQKAMRAKAKEKKGIALAARLRAEGIFT